MKNMKTQKVLRMAVAVMVMVAMLSFSTLEVFAEGFKAGDNALVKVSTSLNVRSGPSLDKTILTTLKNGIKLTILEQAGSWYKVKLASGKLGYVFGKYLSAAATNSNSNTSTAPSKTDTTTSVDLSKLESDIILATTTSTQDTGLLDVLVPAFEKKYNVKVKTVAVGTGEAINMGKKGDSDVLLVHSRAQEDAFVTDGYGVNRKDVMYNFFYIVGPKFDPAGVEKASSAADAFKRIAESKATFISRGDKSGTNTKELSIWTKSGITPNAKNDRWYIEAGQGMGATLTMADEMGAYTLADSGTWHTYETKLNMKIVKENDSSLFNPYGVIAVNPQKYPNIHYNSAMAFVNFITSEEGQKIIGSYKKNGYQLFVPSAK
jgi:tungstate transport system substrate-binding protein